MASLSISLPRKISDTQFIGDLMTLFARRKVKCGEPSSFENFASELASNNALRGDLFPLCTAISHMAAEDLTGEELLALVARALSGTGVAKGAAIPEIPESMRMAFLEGYEAWGNRAAFEMDELAAWPPPRKTPTGDGAEPLSQGDSERAEPKDSAEVGRTFNSALNIAMERSSKRMLTAALTVAEEAAPSRSAENEAVAADPADVSSEVDGSRHRIGAGFLYSLAGVMVIACGLGSYVGYRSLNRIPPRTSAEVKTSGVVSKQGPAVASPTVVAPAAAAVATKQGARAAIRSTAQAAGSDATAVAAKSPVPVTAGAEDSSNSIVGFAPSASRVVHADDSAAGISGTVMLEVSISAQGRVTDARALSGPPELQAKAMQTVRQWRFKPTLVNGVPSQQTTTLGVFLKGD